MRDDDFKKILELSQIKEYKLSVLFDNLGFTTSLTTDKGKFSGYDMTLTKDGKIKTLELKYDIASAKTKNAAVEMYSLDKNGKKQPDGLSATTADYYAYTFPDDVDVFYIYTTNALRAMVDKNPRIVKGGYTGNVFLSIFPLQEFKSKAFKIISDKPFKKNGGLPL